MIAYKLMSLKKGKLYPLFINRTQEVPMHQWLDAEDHPTKGFSHRVGWHCTHLPKAPHLKMNPKGRPERVWCLVEIEDYEEFKRPDSQGGLWYLAEKMVVIKPLTNAEVEMINDMDRRYGVLSEFHKMFNICGN